MERLAAPEGSPSCTLSLWRTPRLPRRPCATLRSTAGGSESTTQSLNARTHPLLASTWANQLTVTKEAEVAAAAATGAAVVAATATEETGVMEEGMMAGATTQGGPHHLTTVVAEEDAAGGTTGHGPDRILHVVIEQSPEISWSPGFLLLLLNAASGHYSINLI